jgi:hypothetical protein
VNPGRGGRFPAGRGSAGVAAARFRLGLQAAVKIWCGGS